MTGRRPQAVLFSGTVDEAAQLQQADSSPAHLWKEARNPSNQWLANMKGRQRLAMEVHRAGLQARQYVRQAFRDAGYPVPPHASQKDLP